MRKRTLETLFILGLLLSFLALVPALISLAAISSLCSYGNCSSVPVSAMILIILASIMVFAGSILIMVSWVLVLIKQAQQQQWAWFVCTLLFSYIPMVIYFIVVPESSSIIGEQQYQPPTSRGL